MTPLDKIKAFLTTCTDISFGYADIHFCNPDNLEDEQIGYSIDSRGNSLLTGKDGDWQQEWIVIASDELGDPIIVDTSSDQLTVVSAPHGEGEWMPIVIADSLDNFRDIISLLTDVSKGRTNPIHIEQNPVTVKERKAIMTKIRKQNPETKLWFWEAFFDDD